MVQGIMSGPPLPSRAIRAPSQKDRPLPSTPQEQISNPSRAPSIKDRKLPPPPNYENNLQLSSSQGSRKPPSTLSTTGQSANKSRPLPPTPSTEQIHNPTLNTAQNGVLTSRRGLPPLPSASTNTTSNSDNSRRPLPAPPSDNTTSPNNRSTGHSVAPPALPQRKTSISRSSDDNDFEKRFYFHDVKDFPIPDEFEYKSKRYSSISPQQNAQRRRRKKTSPTQQS